MSISMVYYTKKPLKIKWKWAGHIARMLDIAAHSLHYQISNNEYLSANNLMVRWLSCLQININ